MNIGSWIERKKQQQQKYDARNYRAEYHYAVACIKRAFRQNRLASIKLAAHHLHNNQQQISAVIRQLNVLMRDRCLIFQWLPNTQEQPASLWIRNKSIGLLIKTDAEFTAEGMMLTPKRPTAFCSLSPEVAFSALSAQVYQRDFLVKNTSLTTLKCSQVKLLSLLRKDEQDK